MTAKKIPITPVFLDLPISTLARYLRKCHG